MHRCPQVFDDRKHKLILGNMAGQVRVYNLLNGALMKEVRSLGDSEVTSLLYSNIGRCLMCTTWAASLTVYDERPSMKVPWLRRIKSAHDKEITCASFSPSLQVSLAPGLCDV